jgi:hypothetical protein
LHPTARGEVTGAAGEAQSLYRRRTRIWVTLASSRAWLLSLRSLVLATRSRSGFRNSFEGFSLFAAGRRIWRSSRHSPTRGARQGFGAPASPSGGAIASSNGRPSCENGPCAPLRRLSYTHLSRTYRGGGAHLDGRHNTRLHLSAPREHFFVQPAVNGCSVLRITQAQLVAHLSAGAAAFTAG